MRKFKLTPSIIEAEKKTEDQIESKELMEKEEVT